MRIEKKLKQKLKWVLPLAFIIMLLAIPTTLVLNFFSENKNNHPNLYSAATPDAPTLNAVVDGTYKNAPGILEWGVNGVPENWVMADLARAIDISVDTSKEGHSYPMKHVGGSTQGCGSKYIFDTSSDSHVRLEAWVFSSSNNYMQLYLSTTDSTSVGYIFTTMDTSDLCVQDVFNGQTIDTGIDFEANRWYHLAIDWTNGGELLYFLDGVQIGDTYTGVDKTVNSMTTWQNINTLWWDGIGWSPNEYHNFSNGFIDNDGDVFTSWNSVPGVDYYNVYRHSFPISAINGSVSLINSTTFNYTTDLNLENGTYYYAVTSVNSSGESEISNNVNITVAIYTLLFLSEIPSDYLDDSNAVIFSYFENSYMDEGLHTSQVLGDWTFDSISSISANYSLNQLAEYKSHIRYRDSTDYTQGSFECFFTPMEMESYWSTNYIMGATDGTWPQMGVYISENRFLHAYHYNANDLHTPTLSSPLPLENNVTYHIAYTFGPTGTHLWLNGVDVDNSSDTRVLHPGVNYFGIGRVYTLSSHDVNVIAAQGKFDDFRVSNIQRDSFPYSIAILNGGSVNLTPSTTASTTQTGTATSTTSSTQTGTATSTTSTTQSDSLTNPFTPSNLIYTGIISYLIFLGCLAVVAGLILYKENKT